MNNKEKILVIDDELMARYAVQQVLKDRYNIFMAAGGKEVLDFMAQNPVDLVVLDIKMPDMDGVTVLREIKKRYPDTEVVLLTAYAGVETAQSALRLGALDYLTKPFDKDDVINVVERGLRKRQDLVRLKLEHEDLLRIKEYLEKEIETTRDNLLLYYEGTIKALIRAIDAKDHYTFDHSEHVARLSLSIADAIGFSKIMKDKLEHAAIMHDIGKIGINEQILRKKSLLTEEEHIEMRKHPEIGERIVREVRFHEDTIDVILYHNERDDRQCYHKRH